MYESNYRQEHYCRTTQYALLVRESEITFPIKSSQHFKKDLDEFLQLHKTPNIQIMLIGDCNKVSGLKPNGMQDNAQYYYPRAL